MSVRYLTYLNLAMSKNIYILSKDYNNRSSKIVIAILFVRHLRREVRVINAKYLKYLTHNTNRNDWPWKIIIQGNILFCFIIS